MANTDTVESLKAEYLRTVTGEAYRSQEEEQAANVRDAKERRQQRIEAQLDSDRQIIADAKADTDSWTAVRFGTRSDGTSRDTNGELLHSSLSSGRTGGSRTLDEEVVYLIPDGITDVTKSERTGCYADVFAPRAGLQGSVLRGPSCP